MHTPQPPTQEIQTRFRLQALGTENKVFLPVSKFALKNKNQSIPVQTSAGNADQFSLMGISMSSIEPILQTERVLLLHADEP